MNNIIVLFVEILIVFTLLILTHKFAGEDGVTAWVCVASVVANLVTAKTADIFGLSTAIGSVLFASTFLATDILTECYSAEKARKAVLMGAGATVVFIICSQIALLYIPSSIDYADGAMRVLFGLNLRISISSVVMYLVANLADVWLFDKMKKKGGKLWVRNNVATITCNCLENLFFVFFAFVGIYPMTDIMIIALSTSIIEALIGVCDTPFIYLARRIGER